VPENLAALGWEHEIESCRRTGELPFAKRIGDERRHRDLTPSCFALGHSETIVAIGAPAHPDQSDIKFNVVPNQASQLAGAHPGKNRCDDQRFAARLICWVGAGGFGMGYRGE
jgi:hypothetical protein